MRLLTSRVAGVQGRKGCKEEIGSSVVLLIIRQGVQQRSERGDEHGYWEAQCGSWPDGPRVCQERGRAGDTWWNWTGMAQRFARGLAALAGARSHCETSSVTCTLGRCLVEGDVD